MKNPTSLVVIPARMHSTRLPKKMLLAETGKPLIQHTFESALQAKLPSQVIVATDHLSIKEAVESFGGTAVMTSVDAPSGTDRIAEVAKQYPEFDLMINVQGDEPEISGEAIDQVVRLLAEDPSAQMSTLGAPISAPDRIEDPACVKVVFDSNQNALYFSRSPIPFARDGLESALNSGEQHYFQHIGLYGYRRDFLSTLTELPVSSLEATECLEQLRVLQNGYRIKVGIVSESAKGIDTREDYEAFVKRCLT